MVDIFKDYLLHYVLYWVSCTSFKSG